jgi:hypothetical protein
MRDLIKKILKEQLEGGENENPLSKKEILLFKYLNKYKHQTKTKKVLVDLIKSMMNVFGLPSNDALFYYEVYTANFREDGDYENLTKENFKDYRLFKQSKTPNNKASEYSSAKIPFKGSNLEGKWDVNRKNEWYYVITSYGWYPVYLFINDKWFKTSDTYSSSTRKQMSQVNPISYSSDLKSDVIKVTQDDIKVLMYGVYNLEEINNAKVVNFTTKIKSELVGSKKLLTLGYGDTAKKVSYTISDIKEEGGKIKITIRIVKAGKVVNNKMVVDNDYQNIPGFVEEVESGIKRQIISSNEKYLSEDNSTFEFIH